MREVLRVSELEKDLRIAIKRSANGVDDSSLVWLEVRNGSCQEGIPTYNIAARLEEMGYVKVDAVKEQIKSWKLWTRMLAIASAR